ncbi:MAG: ABC transporter ATP-binding protein/permease [Planctomycetes bacterium]|nr:ABC transporter ATP-binding protein/permease [Planctomycetota bacterium]MCH9724532.1 ABC transporter ATP-binding protein/permease [Planctomycetota bacterium]MCH9776174.1 ABC transporter ATP-binding protein/permease [Planctomycetota bacterium]MCH9791373.1 ABC transporter ATP-binding protein/permease [Planctomycetota bacterium]
MRLNSKNSANDVNSFARILHYVWPYRKRLIVSFFFAILVALLWGANLSVAFPVIKVLLQGESLNEYVQNEINKNEEIIQEKQEALKKISIQIHSQNIDQQEFKPLPLETIHTDLAEAPVNLLSEHSRQQKKISNASRELFALKWVQSTILPWVPNDHFDTFALILGILLFATLIKGLCIFTQDVIVGGVVELATMAIRKECFRKVLDLDYQSITDQGTAELMSRFTFDMQQLSQGLTLMGGKIIREPLKALACIIFAFMINWRLTLLSFIFAPLIAIVFYKIGKMLKHASQKMMESMSRIYKTLEESFDSSKVIIAFNGARKHRNRFHHENKEFFKKAMSIVRIDSLTSPTTEMLGMMAIFIALIPGAYLVLRGKTEIWGIQLASAPMDVATLGVMYALLAGITDPARKMSSVYSKLKRTAAAAERIFSIIDRESLVKESEEPQPFPQNLESVQFKNIDFTYSLRKDSTRNNDPILDSVNLEVAAGEVVIVVGENGSGKSTLVNLLPRFYDPDKGSVLINENDIRDYRLKDLRNHIGVVSQETMLFDDTILENIRYGRPSASRAEIEAVAKKAHVSQFAEQIPDGLLYNVGEKGQELSGGQRQRIALARAILRDPEILILDEATSAIDSQSEILIHKALKEFAPGRTVFIITHSIGQSLLEFATRIVVMDSGKVVATGPHSTLINTCPRYQNLLSAQVRQRSA